MGAGEDGGTQNPRSHLHRLPHLCWAQDFQDVIRQQRRHCGAVIVDGMENFDEYL